MKKFIILTVAALTAIAPVMASTNPDDKSMEKHAKELKKRATAKVSKDFKKEAKKLEKDNWTNGPGTASLERQCEKRALMEAENDGELFESKYVFGSSMVVAGNYTAAKRQALTMARDQIASELSSEIADVAEAGVANQELDEGEAASLNKYNASITEFIKTKLGRMIPVMEMYRKTAQGKTEVSITMAYSMDQAKKFARQAIIEKLEAENAGLAEKLTKLLEK